jgi:small subunit ribosomal protein S6
MQYPELDLLQKYIKELVTLAATHVMNNGGVVRRLDSWGTLSLPQRMRRHNQTHYIAE